MHDLQGWPTCLVPSTILWQAPTWLGIFFCHVFCFFWCFRLVDLFLETFAIAVVYAWLENLLINLVPHICHEVSTHQYTCDFDCGKAVQVNTKDQWHPKSALYQRVVGPQLRVASCFHQVISSGHEILDAIESMEAAETELGLPVSVEYVGIHNEVEKLLKMNPVLLH